jgi:hypothetical protein
MPDSDPVDPRPALVKKYHKECLSEFREYEACTERIKKLPEPKSCQGWYNDYWKCVDDKVTNDTSSHHLIKTDELMTLFVFVCSFVQVAHDLFHHTK